MQNNKPKRIIKSPFVRGLLFLLTCLAIIILVNFGPAEHSLGTHIRVVYLHGAWVWVSLSGFLLSAIFGMLGLITRRLAFHHWSKAFGLTGLIFWITYIPLSLWAMQSNWNGLYLAEPRWKLALVFTITGILLQARLYLADRPKLTSAFNIIYFVALTAAIRGTENVMHPASPILNSDAWRIQIFFFGLVVLIFFAAWQVARWWYLRESDRV
ncbi:MAG: hypothetical protein C3F13_07005 [Anaerolineales bacterium]|nr:hypothetical protein [Anaerolineae bacterium]PWB54351.1 MAG: hypothetical protein C3F13_07005 [Anaerolineales bacterium]